MKSCLRCIDLIHGQPSIISVRPVEFTRTINVGQIDPEVEEAWEREADRREAELESGSISAVSGQETIARLRARLWTWRRKPLRHPGAYGNLCATFVSGSR